MEAIDNFIEDTPVEETEPIPEETVPAPEPEAPEKPVSQEPPAPPEPEKKKIAIRPEWILGLIALLAAALLIAVLVPSLPYINAKEDPEALALRHHPTEIMEPVTEAETAPAQAETEPPAEPTIPPDPNPYGRLDFQYNKSNYLYCLRTESYSGVDVSAFQGSIDWEKVKASGIDYAIIRLGYRGYGKAGKLVEDEYAQKNLKGATDVGLPIGVYFFSQALNTEEVEEEVDFLLEILGDYKLDMPIVFDWEYISAEARTANMDARTLTDCALRFCELISEKGYTPMVYFNWYQSEHYYYLSELEEYPFWLALYQDRMTFPWKVEMWQYTCEGKVPGIYGNVDINVYMPY